MEAEEDARRPALRAALAVLVLAPAAAAAATGGRGLELPPCKSLLDADEAKLASGAGRLMDTSQSSNGGIRICSWVTRTLSARSLMSVGLYAYWIDPTTASGRKNLADFARELCKQGPAAACDRKDDLLGAAGAREAFQALFHWIDDVTDAHPFRLGKDVAFVTPLSGAFGLVAGEHGGFMLFAPCLDLRARKLSLGCSRETLRFAHGNLIAWLGTQ